MKDMSDCNKNNNQDVNLKRRKNCSGRCLEWMRICCRSADRSEIREGYISSPMRYDPHCGSLPVFRGSGSIVYDNEQYQNGRQYRQWIRQHHRWPTVSLRIRRSRKRRWMLPGRGIQQEQRTRSERGGNGGRGGCYAGG